MNKLELQKIANEVRKDIVTAVHAAKAGHPGGSLSAADLFTYLYFEEMNIDPKEPKKADRDRFVLSKGHTAPGLYSAVSYTHLDVYKRQQIRFATQKRVLVEIALIKLCLLYTSRCV